MSASEENRATSREHKASPSRHASKLPEIAVGVIAVAAILGFLNWTDHAFDPVTRAYVRTAAGYPILLLGFLLREQIVKLVLWDYWRRKFVHACLAVPGRLRDHPPFVTSARAIPKGGKNVVVLMVRLSYGISIEDLKDARASLISSLRVYDILIEPGDTGNKVKITILRKAAFGGSAVEFPEM